ncbi:MAG: N-succinyldiaminopimelate aminotransferase [Myxococcota bacterium]|jgi:N-succinyldiaminopimelate aminotransferase
MPSLSSRVDPLHNSVFAVLAKRMVGYTGERFPFHIGDNSVTPPAGALWPAVDHNALGAPYNYGHPGGEIPLREAIAEKLRSANGLPIEGADQVQVSVGATHAIACALQGLLDPGAEVLILAPYWPIFRGLAHCAAVVPTEVPFFQALLDDPDRDPAELIAPYIGANTRMLYLISPNNPTGLVLSTAQLESIAALARKHDLWVLSDEAYEAYTYRDDRPHVSIGSLGSMAERTLSVYTFSKTYAMAGTRMGYIAGPPEAMSAVRKVATHSVYNPAQVCQAAALAALQSGQEFLRNARQTYLNHSRLVADQLDATFHPAQGGAYVFVDLREFGEDPISLLEQAADLGVTLAPGEIFGREFKGYARFCYTAVDEARLSDGIGRFNQVLRAARG